ncbi:DUF4417 domain-containing protein [Scytonema sp. UIC 10036]|uniref:DUF4417 domain-containing protein n=1 Tax=Scytonema sp. UIC 10036 TaxID=2304196 RepID=UPI0012DAB63E|nr:DUF4417 domain-containing protein [Scytonema sp. UIC 10036]MUG92745.1 DUF4417 domain-containing protein [Scytonema sp. UIC 10036]
MQRRYLYPLNTFFTPELTEQGLPMVGSCEEVPEALYPYKLRSRRKQDQKTGLHFFIDDCRFEGLWRYPEKSISYLKRFDCAIAPDFSLYLDMPRPMKLWNVYRNRWVNSFWNYQGIKTIPCVSWADAESFSYCFEGIPQGSAIAISSMGIIKRSESESIFFNGVLKMLEVLEPKTVLVYGTKFEKELCDRYQNFKFYPHYRKHGR